MLRARDSVAPLEHVAGVHRDPVEAGAAVDNVPGGGAVEGSNDVAAFAGIDDVLGGLVPWAGVNGVPAAAIG